MRSSMLQCRPRARCSAWRHVLPVAMCLVAVSAHADWLIPAGSSWDMGGGSSDLACTDLLVEGALVVGAGGTITGVRNVVIAAGGSLMLDGGTVQLAQQWTNQGTFTAGGGRVVRVDGGVECAAVGPLGPLDFSPKPVPATNPGVLAALALLLAGLGWRMQSVANRRRAPDARGRTHPMNNHFDGSKQ